MENPQAILRPGDIVSAQVMQAEVYGLHLTSGGNKLLVLIPEVSWIHAVDDCRKSAKPGDTITVKVLAFLPDKELYLASVKQVHPEEDPWWNSDETLVVGSEWTGKVVRVLYSSEKSIIHGFIVELCPGVAGLLPLANARRLIAIGDTIRVAISQIDLSSRKITFIQAEDLEQESKNHTSGNLGDGSSK